jgi:hypothetical protein
MSNAVPQEVQAIREAFAEFEVFGDAVWKAINLPPLTERQREIARFLQHGPQRGFIAAFRGIGKSYLAACYALWCLLQDYDEQILILSGSSQRAVDSSLWVRSLLENPKLPFLHHLRPKPGQRDSKLSWDIAPSTTKHSASFAAMSVGSSIQGRRCTKAILDDAEQANNSASALQRESLLRSVMDVEAMLVPDVESKIVVLGTFQSLNSIYQTMTGERGYEPIYIPARVPSSLDEYGDSLAPGVRELFDSGKAGQPSDPKRFDDKHLSRMEVGMGALQWQIQMMLSTAVSDRLSHPLSLDDFIVWDGVNPYGAPVKIVPSKSAENRIDDLPCLGLPGDSWYKPGYIDESEVLPYSTILMSVDPAGDSGADETAYTVIGAVPGGLYVLDAGGFREGASKKTLETLAKIAKRWRVKEILVENNMVAWPLLFKQVLNSSYPCTMTEVRATKNKVERIAGALEPVLRSGQLIIDKSVVEKEYKRSIKSSEPGKARQYLLQYQAAMLRYGERDGGIKHDDRLDALAQGVTHLAPTFLQTETEIAIERMREENAEKEFDEWYANAMGRNFRPKGDLWAGQTRRRNR